MFSVSDFKVSVTSVQFSLFVDSKATLCPKCGHLLDNPIAEVTLSSLVVLIGVGSLVYYKWMSEKSKRRRRSPFGFSIPIDQQIVTNEEPIDEIGDLLHQTISPLNGQSLLSSTPFLRPSLSLDLNNPMSDSYHSDALDMSVVSDDSESWLRTSMDSIGNKTVAKLQQLLDQIQDIKQSVSEIDDQIYDVRESNVKFDPKMFSLGPGIDSSVTSEADTNDLFHVINTEPQTPSLEWDSMDLNSEGQSDDPIDENPLHSSADSRVANISLNEISGTQSTNNFHSLESPEDLTSPSFSTSGEFSIGSNPEPTEPIKPNDKSDAIQKIISDAKSSGLLKDLIDSLVIRSKRDSAYFED